MNRKLFEHFENIPFPPRSELKFIDEIRQYAPVTAAARKPLTVINQELLPRAAKVTLERHFSCGDFGAVLELSVDKTLAPEEFILKSDCRHITLSAADDSGFRYGVCELEERFAYKDFTGTVRRKPWVKHRISRCFFAPNTRPPLKLDELDDEVDYYPEAYLDRMMHERINGVWLTLYLYDMPTTLFPDRGKEAERKLKKLAQVVRRCSEYGIKCYIFMAEPRFFSKNWKCNTPEDRLKHPELAVEMDKGVFFCTSTPEGKQYIRETVGYLFSKIPALGGIINIMTLEGAHPCAERQLYKRRGACTCPRCSKLSAGELFRDIALTFSEAMKQYAPEAEFFGWFYASNFMPEYPEAETLLQIADNWPDECYWLYNCETGGKKEQCSRMMSVRDYSLSWPGPSDYWKELARRVKKAGAKAQTAVSHEDATVPCLPVPNILYERYQGLLQAGNCSAVMQCWYFGSMPGLMNKAAGRLSFLPMPGSEEEFLQELAEPDWHHHAPAVAKAWKYFSDAYQNFPESIAFKWFGPLHFSIVYPWYVYPADLPIAPSYTQAFPKNSGDRIGECMEYDFSFEEIRTLLKRMDELWQKGMKLLKECCDTEVRKKELYTAEATGIQIASTRRLFEFYFLRDDMIFNDRDNRAALQELIRAELQDTLRMAELCGKDSRLGYHSEVESYCFFPEKLLARAELLKDALQDVAVFDRNAPEIDRYFGSGGQKVRFSEFADWRKLGRCEFKLSTAEKSFSFHFRNIAERILLEIEPGRLCQVLSVWILDETECWNSNDTIPGLTYHYANGEVEVRFDREWFTRFRISEKMLWKFNISTATEELVPRTPWPERLCHGTSNPVALLWLVPDEK